MLYIDASLPKALKANDLLSGNEPSEGWGSQYSGNPRSLSHFLPKKSIKTLPPQAENSLKRGASVSSTISSDSASSLLQEESLLKKRPKVSNQGKSCDKRVKFTKTSTITSASSAPVYSNPNLNLDALEALQRSSAIEVIYPKGVKGNKVSSTALPSTTTEK